MARARCFHGGFTLVELVTVILILAILGAVSARFVTQPLEGLVEQERRARLVDRAAATLDRMSREIRLAVPNSIRVTADRRGVELLRSRDGGRYRRADTGGDGLSFAPGEDDRSFQTVGRLQDFGAVRPGADCSTGDGDCLVLHNLGQPGADAYTLENVATVTGTAANVDVDGVVADRITFQYFAGRTAFAIGPLAPYRFQVVDSPVTFRCDPGAGGALERYDRYPITAAQPDPPPGTPHLLAEGVVDCRFDFGTATATRRALITLHITLEEAGERVSLVEQVHVPNLP
jgi:MSHA biogenesis protein MshO